LFEFADFGGFTLSVFDGESLFAGFKGEALLFVALAFGGGFGDSELELFEERSRSRVVMAARAFSITSEGRPRRLAMARPADSPREPTRRT
jgi:hypothetical protein